MPTAIIIDDVEAARINLNADLKDYCPDIDVIGEADGVVSGAKLLRHKTPDILFLDIQMKDGSGFDLLEILNKPEFSIIFTTASDAHAIQAFRFSAIDYLLKPIDPEQLIQAVQKAGANQTPDESITALKDNIKYESGPRKIALHTQEKISLKSVEEIVRCESDVNYTTFYFSSGEKLLVTKTLKEFDQMLSSSGFIRTHQSHLVNTAFIKEYIKVDGGYILLKDGTPIPVSGRKKAQVVEIISNLS